VAEPSPTARRWKAPAAGLLVAALTLLLLVATEPQLTIVWDEGYTLGRVERIRAWCKAVRDPKGFAAHWRGEAPRDELVQQRPDEIRPTASQVDTRAKLFSRPVLDYFWPFAREEPHGHPPFYALVSLVGDLIAPGASELLRARLGPMLLFSSVSGAVFAFFAARYGNWSAALAAGAWVLQPRLFAHAHYALYDNVLTSLWIAAILAFAMAARSPVAAGKRRRWAWAILVGVIAACAADTKLTGWFLPLPFLAWVVLRRDIKGAWSLVVAGLVGLLVLYALCPPFWGQPIAGVDRFLKSNLSRAQTVPIPALFLGRVYMTPKQALPWYNTIVWTAFIAPVGVLAFALAGVWRTLRTFKSEPFGLLVLLNWGFFLVLRALPGAPGHDAERQFLPAFGCLALLAGLGGAAAGQNCGRWARVLIAASLVEGAVSVAAMMPVPLSYYSPVVGGLPGATKLGMEPTYYWDALTPAALNWLNQNTPAGERVSFATNPTSWFYLRRTGRLKARFYVPWETGRVAWYVVQNRAGSLGPRDRALVARLGPRYVLVEKWGVPLIWAFPESQLPRRPGGQP
jgi:4-amino-4-deoxy-L-arabinose transferase-like glycosyltransferase